METGDIILIAVNILTLVVISVSVLIALGIGVGSFINTYYLQQREFKRAEQARQRDRREKCLDEIKAWALDVAQCPYPSLQLASSATASGGPEPWSVFAVTIQNWGFCLARSVARSHHMTSLTSGLSDDLEISVHQLADILHEVNTFIAELVSIALYPTPDRYVRFNAGIERLRDYMSRLQNSATRVLEETARFEAQDIRAS